MEIETVSLGKKKGNLYSSFIIKNLLLDLKMNTPKFSFIIIQPTEEEPKKFAKTFLEVQDCVSLIYGFRRNYNENSPREVYKKYTGGFSKRHGLVIARVFKVEQQVKQGTTYFGITIEELEGVQQTVKTSSGKMVNGIVSPKGGGKVFSKLTYFLNKEEAIYVAFMLEQEINAWRNVLAREARLLSIHEKKQSEEEPVNYNN